MIEYLLSSSQRRREALIFQQFYCHCRKNSVR